jgi:hypothetical protein
VKIDEIDRIDFSKRVDYQVIFALVNETQLPLGWVSAQTVQAVDHAKADTEPVSRDLRLQSRKRSYIPAF